MNAESSQVAHGALLTGKVALVTGASRGIGSAIAQALASAGATVVGTATTEEGASKISHKLSSWGVKGDGIVLNLTDSASIEDGFEMMRSTHGDPDILINNAGITEDKLLLRMKEDDWFRTLDANLSGCFRVTKAALKPMLKKNWGRIINVSSVVASFGNAGQANYAASKGGVEAFTRSLAREVASRGITANCVAPGFVDTDMTDKLTDEQRAELVKAIPVGRVGRVDEVAALVAFLAGHNASYITGQTLHINGGMYFS